MKCIRCNKEVQAGDDLKVVADIATLHPELLVMHLTCPPDKNWYVDKRGYIHGGWDTPIFLQVRSDHNRKLTVSRRKRLNEERKAQLREKVTLDE